MGRRYRRGEGGEVRRLLMAAWCRIRMGDDEWSDGWAEMISYGVLIMLAAFLLGWLTGTGVAMGDLIIEVDYVDVTVWSEGGGFVDEVGLGLSGKGRSLGWIYMYQPELIWGDGIGPGFEFGGWSERYGGQTVQSLKFFGDGDGFLRTALYGETVTGTPESMVSSGYVRRDTQIPLGHSAVYLPFVWGSLADQFGGENGEGDGEPDTTFWGSGWISITAINQDVVAGQSPSFHVGEVLLVTADSFAGQTVFTEAVPEPSVWGGMLAAAAVAAAWGCWQRRRMDLGVAEATEAGGEGTEADGGDEGGATER